MNDTLTAIAAALLITFLSGCGTATMTRLNVSPYETGEFKLVDERPAEQRLSIETTYSYGQVTTLGDDTIAPTPMQLTRTWIGRNLPEWLRNKTVALKEFTVQVVIPQTTIDEKRLKTAVDVTPGGNDAAPLSRLFIGGIENLRSRKTVTTKIVVNADGHDYSGIDDRTYQGRVSEENISVVIHGALDVLRKAIEKPNTDPITPAKNEEPAAKPAL